MPRPGPTNSMSQAEGQQASDEAIKGAMVGGLKSGAFMFMLGALGHVMSPVYRGLTIQFKVYLQMAGMIIGGWVEADHRVRDFERQIRIQRRSVRERAIRKTYDDMYGKEDGDN